jgi:hypothetical protein
MHVLMAESLIGYVILHHDSSHSKCVSVDLCFVSFSTEAVYPVVIGTIDPLLIIDSDVSSCISPYRQDFQSQFSGSAQMKGLSGTNIVTGEGMLCWFILDHFGCAHNINIRGYRIAQSLVHLLSPQTLYKSVGGHRNQDLVNNSLCQSYRSPYKLC